MKIGEYTIRPARPDDTRRLPDVEKEAATVFAAFRTELGIAPDMAVNSLDTFEAALALGHLWVAADSGDEPVGFALVMEIDGRAHLEELDVLPAHARRGLGSALVETVCRWAKASGYSAMTLSTFRDVPWNGPFYARFGFRAMQAGELSPALVRLVERERSLGLRVERRVMMKRDL